MFVNFFKNKINTHVVLTLLVTLISSVWTYGQNAVLLRILEKESGLPAIGASVMLYNMPDSTFVKGDIADENGNIADLIGLPEGSYFLRISSVGFQNHDSEIFTIQNQDIDLGIITLEATSVKLGDVTITAQKQFIERKIDRLIVNVENSILSEGSTAYEVLERSPGIIIDGNDNITMKGRQGIIIYIDGRLSPLSGPELVNYLKSLPSGSISRIELITNPSSKYDAAGNAGIIDIKMRKDSRLGTNGSISAGYGQGVYPKANAGLNLNYRSQRFNLYGSYNYGYRLGLNHLVLDRKFYDNFLFSGKDEKNNYTKIPTQFHSIRIGLDYFLNDKTTLGFTFSPTLVSSSPYNRNTSKVFDENSSHIFSFNNNTDNHNDNSNGVLNLNVKRLLNNSGSEITADLDFGRFVNNGKSVNITHYFNIDGSVLQPDYQLNGDQAGNLNFTTFRTDYVLPMSATFKIEAGAKYSYVSSDQDAKFFEKADEIFIPDVGKTNHFLYTEVNNALYVSLSKSFTKFELQGGLRSERTNYKTKQFIGNVEFDSSYIRVFPTLFAKYNLSEKSSINGNITQRIDRPGFSQLNPFLFLIDVTTYSSGNPALQPQFSWNFELGFDYNQLGAKLLYSKTIQNQTIVLSRLSDVYPELAQDPNVTIQIPLNLNSSDYFGLELSAPVQIKRWWNSMNNLNLFYNHFNGNVSGTALNSGQVALNLNTNNNFTLANGWTAEASFSLSSGNRNGYLTYLPQWALGVGVQKKVLQNMGTIRLNITDIFWTNLPEATISFDNYVEDWYAFRETRVANLAFSYRFGNSKVAQARRRTTGSEEERQRIGNS
ncbi:MAG: TonB-dependent receptor [Saprospiraceae bacterium]|nr:TonB-dependent receptor [Saprospiraceae bacterium]